MHQEVKKKREGLETGGETLNSRKQAHRAMPVWSAAPLRAAQARNPQVGAWGGSDLVVCNSAGAIGQVSQASNWEPGAHRHPPNPIPRVFFPNSTDRLGEGAFKRIKALSPGRTLTFRWSGVTLWFRPAGQHERGRRCGRGDGDPQDSS